MNGPSPITRLEAALLAPGPVDPALLAAARRHAEALRQAGLREHGRQVLDRVELLESRRERREVTG